MNNIQFSINSDGLNVFPLWMHLAKTLIIVFKMKIRNRITEFEIHEHLDFSLTIVCFSSLSFSGWSRFALVLLVFEDFLAVVFMAMVM